MLIDKHSDQEIHIINETAEIYKNITKPLFIDNVDPALCSWVHNILEFKKELDLTVFRNDLFTLQALRP